MDGICKHTVLHDGKRYEAGEVISDAPEQLFNNGAVSECEDAHKKTVKKKATKKKAVKKKDSQKDSDGDDTGDGDIDGTDESGDNAVEGDTGE